MRNPELEQLEKQLYYLRQDLAVDSVYRRKTVYSLREPVLKHQIEKAKKLDPFFQFGSELFAQGLIPNEYDGWPEEAQAKWQIELLPTVEQQRLLPREVEQAILKGWDTAYRESIKTGNHEPIELEKA